MTARPHIADTEASISVSVVPGDVDLPAMSLRVAQRRANEAPPPMAGGRDAPRPDTERSGRGGEEPSLDAPQNLADTLADHSLSRAPKNHSERNQVQRLTTARSRASRDNRRATPNPMELSFLMAGPRRPVFERTASVAPGAPAPAALRPPGLTAQPREVFEVTDLPKAETPQSKHSEPRRDLRVRVRATLGLARPQVERRRAAVPAANYGRPHDNRQSEQDIANAIQSLVTTSTLAANGRERGSARPGLGQGDQQSAGRGARADAIHGPDRSARGVGDPQRQRYLQSIQRLLGGVDLDRLYPARAKAEGRGGLVILELDIRGQGVPSSCRINRSSGIPEFDHGVREAVCSLIFPAPPASWGDSLPLSLRFDAVNPAVAFPH